MSPVLLALLALQAPIDEGSLVVREDTVVVAREAFRLGAVRTGVGLTRWTLATTVRYDRARPVVVLDPIVELGPDSNPASLEYTVADPREPLRILGQFAHRRFTVRMLGRRTERAREFPAPPPTVVLDDSVFALYLAAAWQGRSRATAVTAIFPRGGRRELLMAQELGNEGALRHITITGGANRLVHVWLEADGRLAKVEIPSRHLVAERTSGP
ncbi:MAG TPA: hypothetical protein VM716_07625 [Gemmatimonadales bacterium]|nr:hypothetical protein [Gemmatimonadales bacterium]